MDRERAKKCLKCGIFTDSDEKYCPQYGKTEGHELREVWLRLEDVSNLASRKRFLTKHVAVLEERLSQQKRPT